MGKKIPLSLLLMGFIVLIFGILAIGIIIGYFPVGDIFTGFYTFVFALVVISILGIIGAAFLGMYISHRVFSSRDFSTFEEEMLKMKKDIDYIREKVDELVEDGSN